MQSTGMLAVLLGGLGAMAVLGQSPLPAGKTTGPGVQAPRDSKEPELLKTCKVPPQASGRPPGRGPASARLRRVPGNTR